MDRLTIRRPDDWHLHLRDGAMMRAVLPFTAACFGRAIVMPNLVPPVTGPAGALPIGDYTIEVLAHFSDTMQPASVLAATEGGRRLRGPGMTRGRFGIPAFQIVEDHRL